MNRENRLTVTST